MPHSYDGRDVIYPQIELQVQCNPDQYNSYYVELNKHSKRDLQKSKARIAKRHFKKKKVDLL